MVGILEFRLNYEMRYMNVLIEELFKAIENNRKI